MSVLPLGFYVPKQYLRHAMVKKATPDTHIKAFLFGYLEQLPAHDSIGFSLLM